jgi:hypothetical protein
VTHDVAILRLLHEVLKPGRETAWNIMITLHFFYSTAHLMVEKGPFYIKQSS